MAQCGALNTLNLPSPSPARRTGDSAAVAPAEGIRIVAQAYSECGSFDEITKAFLQGGLPAVEQACHITPGPLRPAVCIIHQPYYARTRALFMARRMRRTRTVFTVRPFQACQIHRSTAECKTKRVWAV